MNRLMAKGTILAFFSTLAVLIGCGEGRMPDNVLWMQEGSGILSATKTGELFVLFVLNGKTGLKKLSGESGELLWEIALSNESRER